MTDENAKDARRRGGRAKATPLTERWANDVWPDRIAPQMLGNGVLTANPARVGRVTGAVVGAAIGDAIDTAGSTNGPLTFGPVSALAIVEAESFIHVGTVQPQSLQPEFKTRAAAVSDPADVLRSSGVLARGSLTAARWVNANPAGVMEVARVFAAIAGADADAAEARALLHVLVKGLTVSEDPFSLPEHMGGGDASDTLVHYISESHRGVALQVLRNEVDAESLGSPWDVLASAISALRTTDSFEACMVAVATADFSSPGVGAVAGCLAGGRYGLGSIPDRWKSALSGLVGERTVGTPELIALTEALLTVEQGPEDKSVRAQ